jgi:hypothetical protein
VLTHATHSHMLLQVYVWGRSSGDVAGDKYEGTFKDGMAHGPGKTVFSDGGWHKGRCVCVNPLD